MGDGIRGWQFQEEMKKIQQNETKNSSIASSLVSCTDNPPVLLTRAATVSFTHICLLGDVRLSLLMVTYGRTMSPIFSEVQLHIPFGFKILCALYCGGAGSAAA